MALSNPVYAYLSHAQKRRIIGSPRRRKPYSINPRRLYTMSGWPVQSSSLGFSILDQAREKVVQPVADAASAYRTSEGMALLQQSINMMGQASQQAIDAYTQVRAAKGQDTASISAEIRSILDKARRVASGEEGMPTAALTWLAGGAVLVVLGMFALKALKK